jgi:single-stranded-DNA-specific exonuclease
MKQWDIKSTAEGIQSEDEIINVLLHLRGIITASEKEQFLQPNDPYTLTSDDVSIDRTSLETAIKRIEKAIKQEESIVVYADYDADGVTAGAVLWETLYALGARVMPYIPHRAEEGYGLSPIGIDAVKKDYDASLIITVDHGITGHEKVAYANKQGIDVIVTDHHTKPDILPTVPIVHTTALSGSGVSWFVAKTLLERNTPKKPISVEQLVELPAIGTIADLLPLTGANRSIAYYGLQALQSSNRIGIQALLTEAGLDGKQLTSYEVSHMIAPRINALGRLEHALDALRLLCTTNEERALSLAAKLSSVNKERQNLTQESSVHAKQTVEASGMQKNKSMLIIADESYNPGIIGLIAGRLVEEYYLPTIVLSKGKEISKASARSIPGFNMVEAIRTQSDLLVDVGGHPMAAGFTIDTKRLETLIQRMEEYAAQHVTEHMKLRKLTVDLSIPLVATTPQLYTALSSLAPFGVANYEPVFASHQVEIIDAKLVGADKRHMKMKFRKDGRQTIDAIAFGMGEMYYNLHPNHTVDVAYALQENTWNGKSSIELKIIDIHL